MFGRIILSLIILVGAGIFESMYNASATLLVGKVAGMQFDASDASYLVAMGTFSLSNTMNQIVDGIGLVALVLLWWPVINKAFFAAATMGLVFILMNFNSPAQAFMSTVDKTEAYTILPNESAFYIPDVGNNKDGQAKMDSEAYYEANKLAMKRFVIPHHKLSGSGGTAFFSGPDSYVPDGRLIIVDRTPQSREWVHDAHRGTSKDDESFPCQSKEGVNIRVGLSIGVEVREENASKFLYHYGVLPPYVNVDGKTYLADRSDPATIFTSVYYGRSLSNVTDDVVRKAVQGLMCNEIASRTFDEANGESVKIMDTVRVNVTKYLNEYGITLDFIGYADTWDFDPEVQKAVNDKYISQALASQMNTLQALNNIRVQEGLAKGLENHGLPFAITPDILTTLTNLAAHVGGATAPAK